MTPKASRKPAIRAVSRAISIALCAVCAASGAQAQAPRLTAPLVFSGETGDGLWAYGQIDKGFLVHDDGQGARAYPLVDNANSSTRGGLWWRKPAADDFVFSANVEAEWNPYSTFRVNRLNDDYVDLSQWRLRKAEAVFEVEGAGRLWLGQGSSASDTSAEKDLSGTGLAAYSSVADIAGGQRFALSGGGLSGISVGAAFRNLDGLGRLVRVRYDTPTWQGLGLQASVGRDELTALNTGVDARTAWDVAAVYAREGETLFVDAALGFARVNGSSDRVSASSSFLHAPSGFSLTLAAGAAEGIAGGAEPIYGYAKLGWAGQPARLGVTALSVDVSNGSDIAAAGSRSLSFGLAAVQSIPSWQTEFYATLRWYDYDDPAASYESALSFLTGARFKF